MGTQIHLKVFGLSLTNSVVCLPASCRVWVTRVPSSNAGSPYTSLPSPRSQRQKDNVNAAKQNVNKAAPQHHPPRRWKFPLRPFHVLRHITPCIFMVLYMMCTRIATPNACVISPYYDFVHALQGKQFVLSMCSDREEDNIKFVCRRCRHHRRWNAIKLNSIDCDQ